MKVTTGRWKEEELDELLLEASGIEGSGERITFLSRLFLGTEYGESTLSAGLDTPEELVVNLAVMDCFTFIDYIEAMRLSRSFAGFIENLRKVRYHHGNVTFLERNHFFSDWREYNGEFIEDVTEEVGKGHAVRVQKMLNEKEDGTKWVAGIPVLRREIGYIPSPLPQEVPENLKAGDYAGIYSATPGLDVSHVGIIARDSKDLYLRHASSRHMKVVDEDLMEYFSEMPGVIILRPIIAGK
jgi:hypothetical protein